MLLYNVSWATMYALFAIMFTNLSEIIQQYLSKCQLLSCARLFATPWTAAHQTPLSMRFCRQGYWSGLPFPSPGDLPNPGIEPGSPALQADSLLTELQGKPLYVYVKSLAQLLCAAHSGLLRSSLGVYFRLASVLNNLFLYVSSNNFGTCFYSFCLLETFLLSKMVRAKGTLHLAPGVQCLEFLILHQATQVQYLGRKLRSLFSTAHCVSLRSILRKQTLYITTPYIKV